MNCNRTACRVELFEHDTFYMIYNEPSTGKPKQYCKKCGMKIVEFNPTLRYELWRDGEKVKEVNAS